MIPTQDATSKLELAKRHRIHGEAAAALEEYRKAGVTEPVELLTETEKEIERRLKAFSENLIGLGRQALYDADTQLAHGRGFVAENLPMAERGEDFNILTRDVLVRIQNALTRLRSSFEDDQGLALPGRGSGNWRKIRRPAGKTVEENTDAAGEISAPTDDIRALLCSSRSEHPGSAGSSHLIVSPSWREDWRFEEGADSILRLTANAR